MEEVGKGGKYFALAMKEVSKNIISRLNDNTLTSADFKEILDNTVKEMNVELATVGNGYTQLTIAAYNVALMCLAHYVILESKVYNDYENVPEDILADREKVLAYFTNVIQSKIQKKRALENRQKVEQNAVNIGAKNKVTAKKEIKQV